MEQSGRMNGKNGTGESTATSHSKVPMSMSMPTHELPPTMTSTTTSRRRRALVPKRRLGQAQFGEVLLCEYEGSSLSGSLASCTSDTEGAPPLVAVKTFPINRLVAFNTPQNHDHTRILEDPFQEIDIAMSLIQSGGHANVLKYEQVYAEDDCFVMIMEYCNELDLLSVLEQQPSKRMNERQSLRVLKEVTNGLLFLHEQMHLAHRDLSLENVLVHNGVCKIADFGLSAPAHKLCSEMVGKPYYMAPEVVGQQDYDPCLADIWSLGMIWFILLTGSPLVELATFQDRGYRAFVRYGLVQIFQHWGLLGQVHLESLDLLRRMLEIDPSKRLSLREILAHPAMQHAATQANGLTSLGLAI